ncbi:hypothetical protein HMI54_003027 [Coelomomyces lativittatus]|nr:hypothetical protein HMI55_002267 [Coelomomyces lativittatus]KAJ1508649.1 hypothetical protein HMI54_003027 [Coelomomyces lativittatus]
MLYAPYQEVLFIDSDVYFLRSPEELFEDPEYKSQGSLFFHDRSLFPDASSPSHAWFKTFVPSPSAQGQQLRHWKTESQHEQESGVVVIHKGTDAFYGLLTTCAMNASPRRDEVYGKVYGDKETFWMGFEAARVPYAFMPVFGSVIGFRSGDYVCGGLLHVNREKKPLWFNNGVQVDKSSQPNRLIELQLYSLDTNTNVGWLFGNNSPDGYCMKGGAVFKLSDQDIITGQWILNSFRKLRENTTMHDLWDGK